MIYPDNAMRIEAQVEEAGLASIAVGDPVSVELVWNQDEDVSYPGTISMISAIADSGAANSMEGESAVTYTVYVDFTPDENTRYGMTAIVSTLDDAEGAEEEETEAEAEGETGEEEAEETLSRPGRGERPEGFDPDNLPEGFDLDNPPEGFPSREEGVKSDEDA